MTDRIDQVLLSAGGRSPQDKDHRLLLCRHGSDDLIGEGLPSLLLMGGGLAGPHGQGGVEQQDPLGGPVGKIAVLRAGNAKVAFHLLEDVLQRRRSGNAASDRETETVSLTRSVIRVLTEQQHLDRRIRRQMEGGKDLVMGWEDLMCGPFGVDELLELGPVRLLELGSKNWIPVGGGHNPNDLTRILVLSGPDDPRLRQMEPTLLVVDRSTASAGGRGSGRNPTGSVGAGRSKARPVRRAGTAVTLLSVGALLAAACTSAPENTVSAPASTGEVAETVAVEDSTTTSTTALPETDPVPEILAGLTPEEKVGQLLMPMVHGTGVDLTAEEQQLNLDAHGFANPTEIVSAYKLGGVIYLESNVDSAQQLRGMSNRLQAAADDSVGIGLLLAIDQEGGRVSRISDEVTTYPPAQNLTGDPARVREAGYVTGQQVQEQGINVVLAPVADVVEPGTPNFIGDRSFGNDPEVVASMVVAAVDGLQQSGVAAAVKHWPGHGATPLDSHLDLPTVDVDRAVWEARELPPFAAAIEEDVSIVLVGHLALPQLDPSGLPATVSPALVDGLLRDELGFDGVVMSDALNMGAVSGIPEPELVVASVNAGVDIILIPPSVEAASAALNQAVASGTISQERLDEAVTRVLRLKHDLGLLPAES